MEKRRNRTLVKLVYQDFLHWLESPFSLEGFPREQQITYQDLNNISTTYNVLFLLIVRHNIFMKLIEVQYVRGVYIQ